MRKDLLSILQHSLGLDQYSQGRQYRNYFVAGGDDVRKCRELVKMGYMVERPGSELSGGAPVYHVTEEGKLAVSKYSPKPPKLTRSQRRYREYLDGNMGETFGEWLKREAM